MKAFASIQRMLNYNMAERVRNMISQPVFEGNLCRRPMRELQSQGIHLFVISYQVLMKVRTMWSLMDPLQAPLDFRHQHLGALCLLSQVE